MNLGEKIVSLRKKNNLSQEELAEKVEGILSTEKVGVTRQTISKWELEETTPDINQAKKLSKLFNISLDELTNNDISNILVEKVSNTEKLAGIIIKILKFLGIFILVFIGIIIALIIFFSVGNHHEDNTVTGKISVNCSLDNEEYLYEVEYNKNYQIIYAGGDAWIMNHIDLEHYEDANQIVAHIEDYFKDHNGSCNVSEEEK